MSKAKITVTGVTERKPKINQDGTVDLVFKGSMSSMVPKGLKSLGDSYYIVHVGSKTWRKISSSYKDDSFLIVQGEPKANKNGKNVPFIEVICFDISIRDVQGKKDPQKVLAQDVPENIKPIAVEESISLVSANNQDGSPKNTVKINPVHISQPKADQKQNFKHVVWYSVSEVIELPTADILLVDSVHMDTNHIALGGVLKLVNLSGQIKYPIAVRPLIDRPGKYALVMGIKMYAVAKMLNLEKIPAVLRDMNHEELTDKLGIQSFESSEIKFQHNRSHHVGRE